MLFRLSALQGDALPLPAPSNAGMEQECAPGAARRGAAVGAAAAENSSHPCLVASPWRTPGTRLRRRPRLVLGAGQRGLLRRGAARTAAAGRPRFLGALFRRDG